ncbi:DinB family protein [Paenibacillus sp. GSMTC-2017]|uniref:DinB family protein n=1 Tax=Paenibacillus sp. GSMTC-2017 TaxID=2794350 RepID=UPI0018D6AE59|nr:DinB family protein [Paenibacillus sp. GSMTC-2017]MBH5317675.1 DinB family protein [Paenibacillus sp. GSMTC-2017]
MAKTAIEMVEEFNTYITFVVELKSIKEEHWNIPIAEGKWTLKDILSHLMLWDKYFYDEAIEPIKNGSPLTSRHLNFNEFNENARAYATTQTVVSLNDQFIEYRTKIINATSGLEEEEYIKEYKDGDKKKFTIRSYLRAFISHDKHHKKQILKYLKTIN